MKALRIEPLTDATFHAQQKADLARPICEILTQSGLFNGEAFEEGWEKKLPLVTAAFLDPAPSVATFFVVARQRSGSFKFFYEMLSRWLIPGKTLPLCHLFAAEFTLPDFSQEPLTACSVSFPLSSIKEQEEIVQNFSILQIEIAIGMQSSFYARRILEIRGLFPDEKTAFIHAHVANIVHRLPQSFQPDLLSEMQHFLVMSRDDFKERRCCQHMSRLISIHYLFRKSLKEAENKKTRKRLIRFKVFRAQVKNGDRHQSAVGIFIGLRFLHSREIFEEPHLFKAISHLLPGVKKVPDSFFFYQKPGENICSVYMEIYRPVGISKEEIKKLRLEIAHEIETKIEHLHQPIFMPRNEEEIMRNMLSLAEQIRYVRDIPQVFLSFDEQTDSSIFFTVICVRVLQKQGRSLQQLFRIRKSAVEYIHDRTRIMGTLRKKYPKEATVFRLRVQKEQFLREDHSIDMYRARRFVSQELCRILGDIRDFNGGMILKETNTLSMFFSLFQEEENVDHLLLENFFHSISPPIMRSLVDPKELKYLFQLLFEAIKEKTPSLEKYLVTGKQKDNTLYFLLSGPNFIVKEDLTRALESLGLQSTDVAFTEVRVAEGCYLGCLVRCSDIAQQKQVLYCIEEEAEKASIRQRVREQENITDILGQRFLINNLNNGFFS